MPTKRELYAGVAFFALAAVAVVATRRPFDLLGWACLVACVAFIVLGCVAILKPDLAARQRSSRTVTARGFLAEFERDADENEHPVGEPSVEERDILDRTISALEAVGALDAGEVDAGTLWAATQRLDPGRTVGDHEALGSFAALHDFGRERIGRLTFVPSHTEYDAPLIAGIAASALSSLGHDVRAGDIRVELPPGGDEGTSTVSFSISGRFQRVACHYRWKYPPDGLLSALERMHRDDDPRELVGADPGDQTLLYAAIRAGSLAELNRGLPAEHDHFQEA